MFAKGRTMAANSTPSNKTLAARIMRHALLYTCCAAAFVLAGCFLPPVLIPTNPDAAFRLSSVLFALGLTAYPIFCSIFAIVDTIRAYRSGQTVEIPLAARLIALALSLLSIAAADSLADSVIRSSTAARGHRLSQHSSATSSQAFQARMVLNALVLLILIGMSATFSVVGDHALFDAMLSFTAGTAFVALLICAILPGAVIISGLMRERTRFKSRTAWSAGERPVAPGTEGLFARDDEKRRRYLALPRTATLVDIVILVIMVAISAVAADWIRPFLESAPALRYPLIAVTAASLFLLLPLLMWWMDCSGRSLTQTIEIDPETRSLAYTLTAGSGSERRNHSLLLTRVHSYKVGPRCITVRCTCDDGKTRTIFAPRTFANEDRFVTELEQLLSA